MNLKIYLSLIAVALVAGCTGSSDSENPEAGDMLQEVGQSTDAADAEAKWLDVPVNQDAVDAGGADQGADDAWDGGALDTGGDLGDSGEEHGDQKDSSDPAVDAVDAVNGQDTVGETDVGSDASEDSSADMSESSGCVDDEACKDDNPCTQGICKVDGSCLQVVLFDEPCDDLDLCTVGDRCDAAGVCVSGVLWDDDGDGASPLDCGGSDCDDSNPYVGPLAAERCNGMDDNCDGMEDEVPPAPVDCSSANGIDGDGLCDGNSGDPTGVYFSAQVVDLGKVYGDVLLSFSIGGDGAGCDGTGAVDISVDGETWQPLWTGGLGSDHLPVAGSLRYIRGGSASCGVTAFSADIACICDAPVSTNCNQANAFDDDSCCCFDTFHTLDMGDEHTLVAGQELECCITTGYSCGCTDDSQVEVSLDGADWLNIETFSTTSAKEGGGGGCDQGKPWISHCVSIPVTTPFRYIRGTNSGCYVDFFECTIPNDCEPKYSCEGEGALNCDDGDSCTIDKCDPNTGCSYGPTCDDGNPCSEDLCDGGMCSISGWKDCEDGAPCSVDSCNPETGLCEHVVQNYGVPACDDDKPCTTDRCDVLCSPEGICSEECSHTPVVCVDEDPCAVESCSPTSGECEATPLQCDDNDSCTHDHCEAEVGCVFAPRDCGDGNPCTQDSCSGDAPFEEACSHVDFEHHNPACDDSDPCTVDLCNPADGECSHQSVDCDDDISCTFDSCDPDSGTCFHDANDAGCDDSIPCTDDGCDAQGGCVHTPRSCDDNDACTTDSCEETTGKCLHVFAVCDDGDSCNGMESCNPQNGECVAGTPKNCDDGNPCNGVETCAGTSGICAPGIPIDCDDQVGCNGVEYCNIANGSCVSAPAPVCPLAEDECDQDGGPGGPPSSGMSESNLLSSIRLRDYDQWDDKYGIIAELAQHPDVSAASLGTVLGDLNREGDRSYVVLGTECFHAGFSFNWGDSLVGYWYPQGISGTASAYDSGTYLGVPVALVSWYHKPEEDSSTSTDKGARVSIINTDDFDDIRYRHALLVEPNRSADGTPNFKQIQSFHAGGIAWYGRYLYVADTSHGFRVFDMTKMLRVSTGESNSIGYSPGNEYHAFGYKYVIPQVNRYKRCTESCCARFSFVSVDRTSSPPALVSGAYTKANTNGRLHRWSLNPDDKRLVTHQGMASPTKIIYPGTIKMQGAMSAYGVYFISSSAKKTTGLPAPATLFHGWPGGGAVVKHGYPAYPEDLHYSSFSDNIWSVTEMPWSRDVFTVKRSSMLYGCGN